MACEVEATRDLIDFTKTKRSQGEKYLVTLDDLVSDQDGDTQKPYVPGIYEKVRVLQTICPFPRCGIL